MVKTWSKVAVALFLLVLLLGGTAVISITVGAIVFAIIGVILLAVLLFSVIRPKLRNRK
jgi:hypothetical protein